MITTRAGLRKPAFREGITVTDLRKVFLSRLKLMHSRWASAGLKTLRWEYWPAEVWNTLYESVETCQSVKVHDNLYVKAARPVMKRLEGGYWPLTMHRSGREPVVAETVEQFCALLDQKYCPLDPYMRAFARVLRSFLLAILTKSLSTLTVRLTEREMRTRHFGDDISLQSRVGHGPHAPTIWSVSRVRAMAMCLAVLKTATELTLKPLMLLSEDFLDQIRVANTTLHVLLFDSNPSRDRRLGIMYFLSAVSDRAVDSSLKTIYLRVADELL